MKYITNNVWDIIRYSGEPPTYLGVFLNPCAYCGQPVREARCESCGAPHGLV